MSETLMQVVMLATVAAVCSFDLQCDVFNCKLFVEKCSGSFANDFRLGLLRNDQMSRQ